MLARFVYSDDEGRLFLAEDCLTYMLRTFLKTRTDRGVTFDADSRRWYVKPGRPAFLLRGLVPANPKGKPNHQLCPLYREVLRREGGGDVAKCERLDSAPRLPTVRL